MATRKKSPRLVRDTPKLGMLEVAVSRKQLAMVKDAEAAAKIAMDARNAILNTIAAAADYDGLCQYVGYKETTDGGVIVLRPEPSPAAVKE